MQRLLNWIEARFPLTATWESQWGKYVAPKNFNFWYHFGALAGFVLAMQVVTGIFLLLMPWYTARDKTKPVPARTT